MLRLRAPPALGPIALLAAAACFPDYGLAGDGGAEASAEASTEAGAGDDGTGGPDASGETSAGTDSGPADGGGTEGGGADTGPEGATPEGAAGNDGSTAPGPITAGAIGGDNSQIVAASPETTQAGDLLLILVYIEPDHEASTAAAYPTLAAPSGFTLASFSPLDTNDANMTTEYTNRVYVWWGYAQLPGAQAYAVTPTGTFHYADTLVVSVDGYATSGNPFADSTQVAIYGYGPDVSNFPQVSLAPSAANTALLWVGTTWYPEHYGYPQGFTNILDANTLSVGYEVQGAATPVSVSPKVTAGTTSLMTATLMSFR